MVGSDDQINYDFFVFSQLYDITMFYKFVKRIYHLAISCYILIHSGKATEHIAYLTKIG